MGQHTSRSRCSSRRKSALSGVLKTQCAAGLICDRMDMEYTHYECCNLPLTFCCCSSPACTGASSCWLLYPVRLSPHATVFQRLQMRFRETRRVIFSVFLNAGRSRVVQRAANENDIIAAAEWEQWKISWGISRELGLSQSRVPWSSSWRSVEFISLLAEGTYAFGLII